MIFIVYEKQNKNAKKVKHRKPKRGSVFSSRKLVMRSKAVKSCEDISDTISVPTGRTSGRDLLILSENKNLKATKNVLIEQTNKKKKGRVKRTNRLIIMAVWENVQKSSEQRYLTF